MNDTQRHVIAGCLIDPDAIDAVDLTADDFTGENKRIWQTILDMHAESVPVDVVTIGRECGVDPSLMLSWCDLIPTTANLGYYGKLVRKEADRRKLVNLAQEALTAALENGDPDEIRGKLESDLYGMASNTSGSAVFARECVKGVIYQLEQAYKNSGQLSGLRTGFKELDYATCGFQKSDLIIIAARPSVGKTAIGMNIAETISVNNQRAGLVISKEMSKDQLMHRMICSRAGLDIMKARRGAFPDSHFPQIVQAAGEINASPLLIDDRELDIHQIRAEARRQKRKHDIKYLMVDYLQLINAPGYDSRTSEVEAVSNQLKACAKELNIPVIALAQINRESDKEKGFPRLDQLKGSGAIEQDADVVILLHREKKAVVEDAKLIIAKQRNGPLSIINLTFDGSLTRFREQV